MGLEHEPQVWHEDVFFLLLALDIALFKFGVGERASLIPIS